MVRSVTNAEACRKWQQRNAEYVRQYQAKYNQSPAGKERSTRYLGSDQGKANRVKISRKYKKRNPEKTRARNSLINAVRNGHIIRPDHCERCQAECVPHGHHDDYSKPLEVEWICAACHKLEHAA